MRIGELADTVGVSVDTIRFYERRGLLDGEHLTRRENNYREYSQSAVDRLRLVKQGQAAGLTLSEIADGIGDWESDVLTRSQKRDVFTRKVAEIEDRIIELQRLRDYLNEKLATMPALDESLPADGASTR